MKKWVAEYYGVADGKLYNIEEIEAEDRPSAEMKAWDAYMQLADVLTITVREISGANKELSVARAPSSGTRRVLSRSR